MESLDEISSLIPHRAPFLWVDKIISFAGDTIITEKTIPADLDVFAGHYPEKPIMPGVLLCEAIFQSGALLMGKKMQSPESKPQLLPVLTRINSAKFKRNVLPGDIVRITVQLTESVSSVSFFKGNMKIKGKTAVQVDFACAMVAPIQ
ncbi:MAG: beta-hydroxyacyl-ACP dehydratase [Desulfobulbaceae bacterium]|nr:beta-hydroxyacyl-ACP dehydratase [Desulfobulbaceae bacterium]